jgi:hypothetical protein
MSPSFGANNCKKIADRAAKTKSPDNARLAPAPAAMPLTATTTGTRK